MCDSLTIHDFDKKCIHKHKCVRFVHFVLVVFYGDIS